MFCTAVIPLVISFVMLAGTPIALPVFTKSWTELTFLRDDSDDTAVIPSLMAPVTLDGTPMVSHASIALEAELTLLRDDSDDAAVIPSRMAPVTLDGTPRFSIKVIALEAELTFLRFATAFNAASISQNPGIFTHISAHLDGILNFTLGTLMHFLKRLPRNFIFAHTLGMEILYSSRKPKWEGHISKHCSSFPPPAQDVFCFVVVIVFSIISPSTSSGIDSSDVSSAISLDVK
mmetsp:Transcript_6778/g.22712  ORF Transcript_6778/g.22712 Transcript_6778/m.22712 type:complete len:233 (-) Transcript_6778:538-1236(-)